MPTTLSIDITRLEKLRERGDKLQARCPACAAEGGDRSGEHLFANLESGAWGCAARPGDREHRQVIWAMVGIRGERAPEGRESRDVRRRARAEAEERSKLTQAASTNRRAIVERWAWDEYALWENSPQRIDQPLVQFDARHFLSSLFPMDASIWTGEVHHSGTAHADRWRTVSDWQHQPERKVGPMVTPAVWKPGTTTRTSANVLAAPFVVLDFDGFDGTKPAPDEIDEHLDAARAITRWLREGLGWRLAAIVHTGHKSLHCWFNHPGPAAIASLRSTAAALGIDAGLIGHPEHPARLPGQHHRKTGQRSRVTWLQLPTTSK